jgi:hypothetical protein
VSKTHLVAGVISTARSHAVEVDSVTATTGTTPSADRNEEGDPMIHIDIDPVILLLILSAIRMHLR